MRSDWELIQTWQPEKPYCSVCSKEGISPCGEVCASKLESLKYSINTQIDVERQGVKLSGMERMKEYMRIQDIIG